MKNTIKNEKVREMKRKYSMRGKMCKLLLEKEMNLLLQNVPK